MNDSGLYCQRTSVPAEQLLGVLLAPLRALHGDVLDAVLVEAEHDAALQGRRRVVEVDQRRAAEADQRLHGALDQLLARLRQHLDGHVVGDQVLARRASRMKSKSVWLAAGKPTSISL